MTLPLSPRMSYGQMRMALYDVAPDLHVASAWLPGKLDGIYCLATNTVLIDRRITYTRKRCALVHELVHWQHGDDTSNGCRGGNSNNDADTRPRYCLSTRPNTLWPNVCMTATRTR
ncbi:hypothetical protein MCC10042_0949 [Bifidobacterium longum subsp. longum]|nr:hypothetical protein MCC10042_0949 [Bifidobacterium longum subsp. longum]